MVSISSLIATTLLKVVCSPELLTTPVSPLPSPVCNDDNAEDVKGVGGFQSHLKLRPAPVPSVKAMMR